MRLLRCSIHLGVLAVAVALLATVVQAGVVTLDVAAKSAVSDTDKIETKGLQVKENQVGVHIISRTLTAQTALLKVSGLSLDSYDIYVDGAYTGEKTAKQLQDGLQLSLPGTISDPVKMHCLKTVLPVLEAENARLRDSKGEEKRVLDNTRKAADWARTAIRTEEMYRSNTVIIAPSGKMLQRMAFPNKMSKEGTLEAIDYACRNIQLARSWMYKIIQDPAIKNAAVVALTPVSLNVNYAMKNGKAHVDAKVVNDTNLPVSGDLSMALPKGWKNTAKTLKFTGLKPGKSFEVAFDLVPPAKNAVAPDSFPIAANVTIVEGEIGAKLKLKINATKAD